MDERQRVSDEERQVVVEALTAQVGTGRLDLAAFDDRVRTVWAASTAAELARITADLPGVPTAPGVSGVSVSKVPDRCAANRTELGAWAGIGLVNVLVWLAVSLGVGEAVYFWPVWVIGPWGLVLLSRAVRPGSRGVVLPRRPACHGPA